MDSEYSGPNGPSGGAEPSIGEILEVVLPHVEKIEEGFSAVRIALDALHEHVQGAGAPTARPTPALDVVAASPPAAAPVPVAAPLPVEPIATEEPEPPPVPTPPSEPEPADHQPGESVTISVGGGNWSQILFGDHLGIDPAIGSLSGSLLSDVYQGNLDAMSLMGCLLTFRSEAPDRKPRLLKDMGEAFYRWRPDDNASLRDALITWVHAELDSVDVGNRITLAQVGDRYDMQRHNAKERGVEVAQVQGWIVLRDNGKVYSKANVTVQ